MSSYLRSLFDALTERLGDKELGKLIADRTIKIALVGCMRGRTLNRSFLVIDEVQNCTLGQVKMLLTRFGWNSTMVVTGNPGQTDGLPGKSGLSEIAHRFVPPDGVAITRFSNDKVVQHPLVSTILGVV
tara:strand:- start:465 stop:851 length:387 start_codon:yes stop_codon:yes gene_type:complete